MFARDIARPVSRAEGGGEASLRCDPRQNDRNHFCDAAQVDCPYGNADAVTFGVPDEQDVVCTAP
jgi:hypothetical protein